MDTIHHVTLDTAALLQPLPVADFVQASNWAFRVWRRETDFDTTGAEGMVVLTEPRDADVNRAILALQHFFRELGHPMEMGAAAVHRLLTLLRTDLSDPELEPFVVYDDEARCTGFRAELLAGAARAELDASSLAMAGFRPDLLAESAQVYGIELQG